MSRFLTFCLLIIPLTQGLSVLQNTAPSLTVLKTNRQLEEEVHENITSHLKPLSVFIPLSTDDNGEHSPLHVKVTARVRDLEITNVDNNLYDFRLDLVFRQQWNDKRLAYDVTHHPDFKYVILNSHSGVTSIWKPDTFFDKSVKEIFHNALAPNVYIRVYPNGDVLYSVRTTITLRCVQNNTEAVSEDKKPIEKSTLVCPMRIASYGYTNDRLVYEWNESPVEVRESVYLPHFNLDKVTTETDIGSTKIGSFSSLRANFHFSHK